MTQLHRAYPGIRDDKDEEGWSFDAWKEKHMSFAVKNVPGWVDAVKVQYGTIYLFLLPPIIYSITGGPYTSYATVGAYHT